MKMPTLLQDNIIQGTSGFEKYIFPTLNISILHLYTHIHSLKTTHCDSLAPPRRDNPSVRNTCGPGVTLLPPPPPNPATILNRKGACLHTQNDGEYTTKAATSDPRVINCVGTQQRLTVSSKRNQSQVTQSNTYNMH